MKKFILKARSISWIKNMYEQYESYICIFLVNQ